MDFQDRIRIDAGVRGGKPCIASTRTAVCDMLEYLAGGMSEHEVLADFSALSREGILATLPFAAARERRLAGASAAP